MCVSLWDLFSDSVTPCGAADKVTQDDNAAKPRRSRVEVSLDRQEAVTAYFKSEQLPLFGFVR